MIIIPDIHGRTFWKQAIQGKETEDIVFLGDYLDPYSDEGISGADALLNFREILAFKRSHQNNVTLLLGNHDLGYLCRDINIDRQDYNHYKVIKRLLSYNLKHFQLCTSREIAGKTYIFSHAFLNSFWLDVCMDYLDCEYKHEAEISDILNKMLKIKTDIMYDMLGLVSQYRCGEYMFGSMVWSDLKEVNLPDPFVDGIFNVFGHTQVPEPVISQNFACLNTKHAFSLDAEGTFQMIND